MPCCDPHMLSIYVLFIIFGLGVSVVKYLPSTDNALNSIHSTIKKQEKKETFSSPLFKLPPLKPS